MLQDRGYFKKAQMLKHFGHPYVESDCKVNQTSEKLFKVAEYDSFGF